MTIQSSTQKWLPRRVACPLAEDTPLRITTDCSSVDWQTVANSLKSVGMSYHKPEVHQRAFHASHLSVFIYDGSQLLGFGRVISDGEYQGAIYDVAVIPEAQGRGVGKHIVQTIMERLPDCNLILYATPGMEGFYKKLGFGSMTTGMATFVSPEAMKRFTE
jgi:ribosomal protein S18 acetylase RimI-like enzyme